MSFTYTAVAAVSISALGSLKEGKDKSDSLEYNAQVQENNAKAALMSAKLNAEKNDIMAQRVMGQISANYAASGVEASSGSVLDVMSASAMNAELDRQNILYGGQVRSINYENQASLDRSGAKSALGGSYFSAFGKLVQGGAMMYGGTGVKESSSTSTASDYQGNYDTALGTFNYQE